MLAWPRAYAQAPIVIKFSHVTTTDTPKGRAVERFRELAEKATNGRVKVEIYPNSTLYKDKEELEALQLGAVQMLAPSLAKFGLLGVREFEAFDIPFMFPSRNVLLRVTEGPIGRKMLRKLEPKGITGLAYWDNGFKVMTANRPLRTPADFQGLKMRIQASKVLEVQFRALGAIPQAIGFSDTHQALKSDVVEGTENTPSNIYTQKIHEVQKHLTVSGHGYLGYAVIANKKFWDSLPGDIRGQLEGAIKETTRYINGIAEADNAQALENIRKSGKTRIHVLDDNERAQWRRALQPVRGNVEARVGRDVLQAIDKEAAALGFK
ncbi:MAG: TRAP transporter substrate-binding protein [Lacisediminimonas sp.]|nr:TRAP transporter substrate-binding protein [Lacisediminimonas sp.]MDO8300918.1 TRAP transporter substrate-binding protein [Lacisediminimonas sp.]MDO9216771.1 TRAP transporter substrate-binding protein [Lacisediminimonas sp.]